MVKKLLGVFLLVVALTSQLRAKELELVKTFDPLTGIEVELPEGWSYNNTDYGLVFTDMKSFVVIKGYTTKDHTMLVKNLFKEMSYFSKGNVGHAYKKLKTGFAIYSEPLSYPYIYLDPNVQMFLFKLNVPKLYRAVHVVFPSGKFSLIVSLYLPEGAQVDKEGIVKILSSLSFLPLERRISWSYAKITEPENGMTAVLVPVPKGYNFSGRVVEQGTKRWFFYHISKGESMFSVDLIDIKTQGVGANFHSLLIVNGMSSVLHTPLCITSEESLSMFLTSLWKAQTGKEWKVLEMKTLPSEDELERAVMSDIPVLPNSHRVNLKGALIAESSNLKRIAHINLKGVVSFTPGIVASQSCFQNLTLFIAQFPKDNTPERHIGIFIGIHKNTRVNPSWSLYAMGRFIEENMRLNQMVREMTRESQEFNSWMSKTWTNLL
ncbi:MAG: hypothetical protein D6699_04755, partial [Aquificota bacterium]